MQAAFPVKSSLLLSFVIVACAAAQPGHARPRERVWNQVMPCPSDAPVLVGSEGSASRFTALSGCSDVRVVPQADPAAVNDHQPGRYVVQETARDEDGRLESGYYSARLTDGRESSRRKGDVRVSSDYTAAGTPVVTIAPVEDEAAATGADRQRSPGMPQAPVRRLPAPARQPAGENPPAEQIAATPPAVLTSASLGDRLLSFRADRATPFDAEIAEVARRQRVDPLLLHAVIKRESAYRGGVVSRAGAIGAMQVMPGTGRMLGLAPSHLRNPRANIEAGARLLRRLAQRYKGNFELVLAAYNAGEGAVAKYGNRIPPYAETQAYVRAVLSEYGRLAARAGLTLAAAGR